MNGPNLFHRSKSLGQLAAVLVFLSSSAAFAASGDATFSKVKASVKATPARAATILKRELRELRGNDRLALASGVLDATYRGLAESPAYESGSEVNCDDVEKLFRIALVETPEAAPSLLAVAIKACPSRRTTFTRLTISLLPPGLADSLFEAILAVFGGGADGETAVLAPGTINPANIGGGGEVVSPAE